MGSISIKQHILACQKKDICVSLCYIDDSPFKQSILVRNHNAAEEGRTQEQLELYFKAGCLDLPCLAQSDEVAKIRFLTWQNVAIQIR